METEVFAGAVWVLESGLIVWSAGIHRGLGGGAAGGLSSLLPLSPFSVTTAAWANQAVFNKKTSNNKLPIKIKLKLLRLFIITSLLINLHKFLINEKDFSLPSTSLDLRPTLLLKST
jgi:hypothetical protein